MYKLSYFENPNSNAYGTFIGIVDDNGREVGVAFASQEDAFYYIKTELEHDDKYKEFISKPDIYAKEIYDELNDYDKIMIQKSLVHRYRNQCMYKYFNK